MMNTIELEQVTHRTVAVTDWELGSSAGAVALNTFIVVIDATMKPSTARLFRKKIEERFALPVKFFVLTHYHDDHALVLGEFKDICLLGSHLVAQKILDRKNTEWSKARFEHWKQEKPEDAEWLEEVEVLAPTVSFQNRLGIRDDALSVELYHSGGHTDCSVYAYAPQEKVIFAGDLLFAKVFPYAGDSSADPDRWIEIFEEWLALDFEHVVPGHGPVVGRDEIMRHLNFFNALKQATQEAIAAGKGPDEIQAPEFYEVAEEWCWIKTGTLQRFHTFYQDALRQARPSSNVAE